jgi:hypothetical protein
VVRQQKEVGQQGGRLDREEEHLLEIMERAHLWNGLKPIDMEVCYWALLFMPLVILHHLLNLSVQLANKRRFKQKKIFP